MCREIKTADVKGFRSPEKILGHKPDSLLLAYSGGADSSLLLHLLCAWCKEKDVKLFAAHVNHSIRGDEALRDRDFCIESAQARGVKCFVLEADVPAIARERKKGIEESAREVRYEFFREIMEKEDIEALVTAHNADDNLETLIFRFTRGSGAKGLCGIPEKRALDGGRVAVRPILSIKKEEILDICRQLDIKYVCDSTNSDDNYARNRIRLNVIPQLKEINPSIYSSGARLSALISADCDFIDAEAEKYMSTPDCDKIGNLQALHPALLRRVTDKMMSHVTDSVAEYVHFETLSKLICEGKPHSSLSFPGGCRAVIDFDRLVFRKSDEEGEEPVESAEVPLHEGENRLDGGYLLSVHRDFGQISQKNQTQEENIYTLFTQVTLSFDKIVGNLFCRPRRSGDKIKQGGFSKDVRKLMSERKLPLNERQRLPIICDGDGILWIPDVALRDGAKAQKGERTITLSLFKTK